MTEYEEFLLSFIAKKLKAWRKHKGLTQAELADITGLQRSHINHIERKHSDIQVLTLIKLVGGMKITMSEFFRGAPRPKKK